MEGVLRMTRKNTQFLFVYPENVILSSNEVTEWKNSVEHNLNILLRNDKLNSVKGNENPIALGNWSRLVMEGVHCIR